MTNFSSNTQRGYIALMAALILSFILVGFTVVVSNSGFFSRFNAEDAEFKRVSLGLAESCANAALLKIGQNYNYTPAVGGDTITVGTQTCLINSVSYGAPVNNHKTATILTSAKYLTSYSSTQVQATVQDPTVAPVQPPPTCTMTISPSTIFAGSSATIAWSTSAGATSFSIDNGVGSVTPVSAGSVTVHPSVSSTYTGTVSGPGGTSACNPASVSLVVQPAPNCADTFLVLDRTGSMSSTDLSGERTGANGLLNLYGGVSPKPQSGVGSFGGLDGSSASVPTNGQLSVNYTNLTNTVNSITGSNSSVGSNLGDALLVASNELNGPRHRAGYGKVLIMQSDGVPNRPTSTSGSVTSTASAVGNLDSWIQTGGSSKANAVSSNDSDTSYVSEAPNAQTFSLQNSNVPAGSTISSVTLYAVAKQATGANTTFQFIAENGSSQGYSTSQTLTAAYATYSWAMSTNPITGSPWTLSEVNSWTTKFGVFKNNPQGSVRVTNIYAVVSYASTANTGFLSPSATSVDTGGSGNGFEGNATGAYADGGTFASNANGAGDRHRYYNYNITIPNGTTVAGIEVRPDWWLDSTQNTSSVAIELSWNGGVSWTAAKTESTETTTDTNSKIVGASNDTWGRAWSAADFSNTNFRVRITSNSNSFSRDFFLDWLPVRITYTNGGSTTVTTSGIGNFDAWTQSGGTSKANALSGNDSDASFITESTNGQTFAMQNSNVPIGSTINSVTLNAVAKEVNGNATLQLIAENGTAQSFSGVNNLTTTYATYSWTMNTNPLTSSAWTLSEVNNWTTKFGVFKNTPTATARVTNLYVTVSYTIVGDPTGWALAQADAAKQAGIEVFTIHYGDTSGRTFLASLSSGTIVNPGHQPGSKNDAGTSTTQSVIDAENADGDHFFISPNAASLQGVFQTIAGIVCPAAAAPPGAPPPPAPPAPAPLPPSIIVGSWGEKP